MSSVSVSARNNDVGSYFLPQHTSLTRGSILKPKDAIVISCLLALGWMTDSKLFYWGVVCSEGATRQPSRGSKKAMCILHSARQMKGLCHIQEQQRALFKFVPGWNCGAAVKDHQGFK